MSNAESSRRTATGIVTTRSRKSRAVSDLNQQQIQRKRDLDRKAQRALRQRTKTRIQELEETLARVQGTHTVHDSSLENEVQRLRRENQELKTRLDSIARYASHGNFVSRTDVGQDTHDVETLDAGVGHEHILDGSLSARSVSPPTAPERAGIDVAHEQPPESNHIGRFTFQRGIDGETSAPSQSDAPQPDHLEDPYDRDDEEGICHYDPVTDAHRLNQHSEALENSTVNYALFPERLAHRPSESLPMDPEPHDTFSSASPNSQVSKSSSISSVLPRHTRSTCPLDHILVDFLATRRAMQSAGTPAEILAGPEKVSVIAVVRPDRTSTVHPVNRMLAEVLLTFPHVKLPEKIAFMYLMHRTMRWLISPTKEAYVAMPQWLRPTAAQIAVPHAAWIDNIPWPHVRDMLIDSPDKYPFEVFSSVYSQSVTVNWPYDSSDVVSHDGDEVTLNPIFEKHVRKLSNWTAAPHFREFYPEMVEYVYCRD